MSSKWKPFGEFEGEDKIHDEKPYFSFTYDKKIIGNFYIVSTIPGPGNDFIFMFKIVKSKNKDIALMKPLFLSRKYKTLMDFANSQFFYNDLYFSSKKLPLYFKQIDKEHAQELYNLDTKIKFMNVKFFGELVETETETSARFSNFQTDGKKIPSSSDNEVNTRPEEDVEVNTRPEDDVNMDDVNMNDDNMDDVNMDDDNMDTVYLDDDDDDDNNDGDEF